MAGWFTKTRATIEAEAKKTLGKGIFRRCVGCSETIKDEEFVRNYEVCPNCGHHYRLRAPGWVELLLDEETFVEHDANLHSKDPLGFVDSKPYPTRVTAAQKKSGHTDAFVSGSGKLNDRDVELGLFAFHFMGGSMGSVVGEKITRTIERGLANKAPVLLLSSSGGARMQEGALSLMQMAKSVSALGKLREANIPFISILADPTTGGVAASFALIGDVNIAEPGALIGFAGARVIEQTIRQTLPEGFQRAEFLLDHGMVDAIVPRLEMKAHIGNLLSLWLD